MKVKGLDGKMHTWYLVGYTVPPDDSVERSSLHLKGRSLLRKLFPLDKILEEVPLPGSGGLTADFVIVSRRLVVETHGEQHYKFVPHFHGTESSFKASQIRDSQKENWCQLNNLKYIELPFYESESEWEARLT